MTTIRAKAYIPSIEEILILKRKFPAFVSSLISESIQNQEIENVAPYATVVDQIEGNTPFKRPSTIGQYFLRTPNYDGSIQAVARGGVRHCNPYHSATGLRIGVSLKYLPTSQTAISCRYITRSIAWSYGRLEDQVTSTAPIITFAGIDYIWLNKEECESGQSQVMDCISLDLICKAEPFYKEQRKKLRFLPISVKDKSVEHNDYARAEELRTQCKQVAFASASDEELEMVIEVKMSDNDEYASVLPVTKDENINNEPNEEVVK